MTYAEEIHRSGFAIIEGLLSQETVRLLLLETNKLQAEANSLRGGVRNLLTAPQMRAIAESDAVLQPVRAILGDKARIVRGILFDKTPAANWKVPWHQDVTIAVKERVEVDAYGPWSVKDGVLHVQPPAEVLEHMLTIRIHLDDCLANNGPLRVIEGTHALGKVRASEVERMAAQVESISCEVQAGGALVMRPLLFHASSSSDAPGHRRVIHFDYASCELAPGLQWHEEPVA